MITLILPKISNQTAAQRNFNFFFQKYQSSIFNYIIMSYFKCIQGSSSSSCKNVIKLPDLSKLPQPKFRIIDDYNIPDAPPRPAGYIRYNLFSYWYNF